QVRAFAGRRNRLAEFDSFFKADRPKFIARHAVSLDRIATVEQSQQVRDRKRVLWLFAPAARACRYEDNGLSHGENLFLICAVEPIGQSVNGGRTLRNPKTPPNGGALVGAARPVSGSGATGARCELERLAVADMCVKLAAVKRTRT